MIVSSEKNMRPHIILLSAIIFLSGLPIFSFAFSQNPNLKVNLSIDKRNISKDADNVIKAKICVANTGKQSVLIVVDEPIQLLFDVKKRKLSLGLWRFDDEFNYRIPQLK